MRKQRDISGEGPATPPEATSGALPEVSGVLLRALADVALHYNVAPEALLGADAKRLSASEPVDIRMPLSEYRVLLTRAIALTGQPALGLHCALHASDAAFDLLAPLVAHVPTLRHAIQVTRQFQALAFEGAFIHLTERSGTARLQSEFPRSHEATDRSLGEFFVAGLMRMLRSFGGSRVDVHAACFEHKRPGYHPTYTAVFEGTERFGQPFTGIEFAAHLLDRPNLHANPSLQNVVHHQAEERLERLARPADLVDRLRAYLMNQPASCVPDMEIAARALGVSVRSLRRRLSEAGHSYREMTCEMQRERACMMLRNPEFTLQAVADAVGFADTAAFHRAFRRWTGRSACEYRDSQNARAGRARKQRRSDLHAAVDADHLPGDVAAVVRA